MSRMTRILGITMVVTALIALSISGAVFAAGGKCDNGNQGDECPYNDCLSHDYSYNYNYAEPGPHGAQNGEDMTLLTTISSITLVDSSGPMGPAPNAGDGVSDGSGFDAPNGANGDVGVGSGPKGPAPNSGDGIPDGSGF